MQSGMAIPTWVGDEERGLNYIICPYLKILCMKYKKSDKIPLEYRERGAANAASVFICHREAEKNRNVSKIYDILPTERGAFRDLDERYAKGAAVY